MGDGQPGGRKPSRPGEPGHEHPAPLDPQPDGLAVRFAVEPGPRARVGEVRLAADGGLASATFPPWRPPPEFFLAGRTAKDVFMAHDMAGEQAINDTVVEWKTRQLPGWLQKATGAQLPALDLIAQRYGVRGIPTLMIFKEGQLAATKVGAVSKAQLTAFIDAHL